jgi:ribosomal protein L7/L12
MPKPISDENMVALSEFILRGQKIDAIELYRELTNVGLKEAKDEVEAIEASLRRDAPNKFTAAPKTKGCFGAAAVLCLCGAFITCWIIWK